MVNITTVLVREQSLIVPIYLFLTRVVSAY